MRLAILALLVPAVFTAQAADSKQTEVDHIFAAFNTHTPGCAVGVAQHGSVALKAGYGMADLERNVPITPDTIFESGSVAKQFTAMALLLLEQQGKISLDDPLRKYLPELPDYGSPLTVRHVLSHVSGLREWRLPALLAGTPEGTYILDNHDLLRMAAKQRALNFVPGTAYSYTNTGFNISTILIERALGNGKRFQDFTRGAIFEPLGMTHTRWRDDFRAVVPNRALSYHAVSGGAWVQDTPVENIIGAGGLLSTVGDWLLWNENFTDAKVGGVEIVKAQQTPAKLVDGRTIAYAKGLEIATLDGLREVSHSGSTGGYRTYLARFPDQTVSVAVMCNTPAGNPVLLGRQTARLWTGGKPAPEPIAISVQTSTLQQWTGMYRKQRDNAVVELVLKDGKLEFSPGSALVPTAPGTFVVGERKLVFEGKGFRDVTPNGDTIYERVEVAHPNEEELRSLAGHYESPDTGSPVTIALKDSGLMFAIASQPALRMRPTFRDGFMIEAPGTGAASVRFLRDSGGKVTGFSAGDDRAWDIRFERVDRQ